MGGDDGGDDLRAALMGSDNAKRNDALHEAEEAASGKSSTGGAAAATSSAKSRSKPRSGELGGSSAPREDEDVNRTELMSGSGRSESADVALEDLDFTALDVTSTAGFSSGQQGDDGKDDLEAFLQDMGSLNSLMEHLEADPELRAVCAQESDLGAFAEKQAAALDDAEREAIEAYLAEEETVSQLYDEMGECDQTLEKLEDLLLRFQVDIGGIGAEIRDLQNECLSHQIKLDNRKKLEVDLGQFIDGINVSESLRHALLNDKVDDVYLEYLIRFNQQISFMENNKTLGDGTDIAAYKDVEPKVKQLRSTAEEKVRAFIMEEITTTLQTASARGPGITVLGPDGVITALHKKLVGFSYFFQFLFKHAPAVADEVRASYAEQSSKLYAQHFKALFAQAARKQFVLAGKNDLIGVEESKLRGFFSGRKTIKNKASVFALGRRAAIVASLGEPPEQTSEELLLEGETGALAALGALVPGRAAAELTTADSERQSFETLFRALVWDLTQAVKGELSFIQDFFLGTFDDAEAEQLFSRPLDQLQGEWLEKYVTGTYDAVGVLLCLLHVQHSRNLMHTSLVHALDGFFSAAHGALAARFFHLCSLNAQSIQQATDHASSIATGDVRAHYMTRRYAEFVSSLTHLCRRSVEFGERRFVDKVMRTLVAIRESMQRLLTALAVSKIRDKRTQTVFLINNLDLIVSVLREHEPKPSKSEENDASDDANGDGAEEGQLDRMSSELDHFERLLDGKIRALARVELDQRFADLLDFAQRHAALTANESAGLSTTATERDVESLLRHFHDSWRAALKELNDSVMEDFSNFNCGSFLLKLILDELADAYSIIVKVVRTRFKSLRTSKYFVPEATVEAERQKWAVVLRGMEHMVITEE